MKKIIKYYPESWYRVEYEIYESELKFKAYKITAFDQVNSLDSEWDLKPSVIGSVNYDDCMDFKQDDHYCGIYHAEQTLILIKDVYKFKKENLDE